MVTQICSCQNWAQAAHMAECVAAPNGLYEYSQCKPPHTSGRPLVGWRWPRPAQLRKETHNRSSLYGLRGRHVSAVCHDSALQLAT